MISAARATFAERWTAAVACVSERPFLTWDDGEGPPVHWSYEEFDSLVRRVQAGLVARGAAPGVRLHVALTNSPAFVALWLAAVQIGMTFVPSDPNATSPELAEHIQRVEPVVGVCSPRRAAVYRKAASGAAMEILEVDERDTELADLHGSGAGATIEPSPSAPAAIMFTSGTTSRPKGVVVTQANYAFAGDVMAAAAGLDSDDRQFVVLPLFHANAQYYSFAAAISVGASVVLMHSFSASGFLDQAARHRVTHASLFAAPMRMILIRGPHSVEGLRLRHVWYAQNVSLDQYEELANRFGCRPRQLYGMTETMPAVLTSRAIGSRVGSIGTPTLGCSVQLRDPDDGAEVPDGEVGEIVVGGAPGVTLFAGYLDDQETTKASYRDGWFRTGDFATRDEEGHYDFVGRRGDVLKVAGENVSTVEVEAALASHPSVLEVAVVGRADEVRDEVPVAYVVLAPDARGLERAALERHCASRLAPSKRPREIHFVSELPRTSVGKVRKFLLAHSTVPADGDRRDS